MNKISKPLQKNFMELSTLWKKTKSKLTILTMKLGYKFTETEVDVIVDEIFINGADAGIKSANEIANKKQIKI